MNGDSVVGLQCSTEYRSRRSSGSGSFQGIYAPVSYSLCGFLLDAVSIRRLGAGSWPNNTCDSVRMCGSDVPARMLLLVEKRRTTDVLPCSAPAS
jgi:hypothetical protein